MTKIDRTGIHVIYYDEHSTPHDALVTADWGKQEQPGGSANIVFVTPDENMGDQYGRQLKRETSIAHISNGNYSTIMARCWCTREEYEKTYKNKIPQRP